MFNISIQGDFKNRRTLKTFSLRERTRYRRATLVEMKRIQRPLKRSAVRRTQAAFNQKRRGFSRAWGTHVYNNKPQKFPATVLYNNIDWMAAHEKGATVRPRRSKFLLFPVGNKRVKPIVWRKRLAEWAAGGRTFFRKGKGNTIVLYAPRGRLPKSGRFTAKQVEGARPVAIGIPRARLRSRFSILQISRRPVRLLAGRVERRIAMGGRYRGR